MTCECIKCGRLHQPLGNPPWALSHDDLTRLSRQFNTDYRTAQDQRINEWLKRLIVEADGAAPAAEAEARRQEALAKLTDEERVALGLGSRYRP